MNPTKEPYGFDPLFEQVVLYFLASKRRFYAQVGAGLDPDCFSHPQAKLVVNASKQLAKELGHGPESTLVVIQRLRRYVNDGKVTLEEIQKVNDIFSTVEDLELPSPEAVAAEILPILRRRLQGQAIQLAHDAWGKPLGTADFKVVSQTLERAENLGKSEQISSTQLINGFAAIEQLTTIDRLPTGVLELDLQLNGGLGVKQLGVWVGNSGGGKSMALVHQAAEALRQQLFVGFATLELPEAVQLARLYANLTGIPTQDIIDNNLQREEAKRRHAIMTGKLGICEVAEFAPHATTVEDILTWIESVEQLHGCKMDLLVLDYADKLHARMKVDNDYIMMRYVYEGLRRDIAMARDMWVWTASQASRPSKDSSKKIDVQHVADSMHKVRVADLVTTINTLEDGTFNIFVAKNRMGLSQVSVGPLQPDFRRARFVPLVREFQKW